MTHSRDLNIIATSFVADDQSVATTFPSVGAVSSAPAFQAVYWRCIVSSLFSARCNCPDARLMLFSNVPPPIVDGFNISQFLIQLDVEIVKLPLTHRLPISRAKSWGNVFYVLDILDYLHDHRQQGRFLLLDSDVLITAPLNTLFDEIERYSVVGYDIDTPTSESINGLSRDEMTLIAQKWGNLELTSAVAHLGGELFAIDLDHAASLRPEIGRLWKAVSGAVAPVNDISTEEQFWSVFFGAMSAPVRTAKPYIKRMWTDPRHNTVRDGDEAIPLWHLPSEKRHGFLDLFTWVKRQPRDHACSSDRFRVLAGAMCGVPTPGIYKVVKDGVRRVRRRLAKS